MILNKLQLFSTSDMFYLKSVEDHGDVSTDPQWLRTHTFFIPIVRVCWIQ